MAEKTLFEKIIDHEIPSDIVYEDDHCIAIHDINPQAPTHVLLIPKKPITRVGEAEAEDQELLGYLLLQIRPIAEKLGIEEGFRIVMNNGLPAGETVPHMHIHILGGRSLTWPPG